MRAWLRLRLFCLVLALAAPAVPPAWAEPSVTRTDPALQKRVKAAIARQPQLVQDAIKGLEPHRPGIRDLYFLGFGGYGDQDVFRKEVERVREQFDRDFGTRGRSLVLINSPGTLDRYPLATLKNLKAVLTALGKQIDRDEDILFLFMTSHGVPRSGLAVRFNGKEMGDIGPRQLAGALAAAGIKNRVVLVSGCFSGQFVPSLANADSLVMTAAAANRTSFGCTAEAEWTYFGKGYFLEALPKQKRFISAFYDAQNVVAVREVYDRLTPSEPQISIGARIEEILKELGY